MALRSMGRGRGTRRRIEDVRWGRRLRGVLISLRQRCTNPKHRIFELYGARGVFVSAHWSSFWSFYEWAIASGYRPGLVLELVGEARCFGPSTCRWITQAEKVRRDRGSLGPARRRLEAFGEAKTMPEWAEDPRCRVSKYTLRARLKKGISPEQAISAPPGSRPPRDGRRAGAWNKPRRYLDWKEIERLYVREELTANKIAHRLKAHESAIRQGLADRGLFRKRERRSEPELRLRKTWTSLWRCCENPEDPRYRYYGGQGKQVCAEWKNFEAFRAWALSSGYTSGLCLSLRSGTRVYSPRNAIWVARSEAAKNGVHPPFRFPPRWTFEAFGERKGPTEWSRDPRCKVTLTGLRGRLKNGWDPEDAISIPPLTRGREEPTHIIEAFGTRKGLSAWERDGRCRVTHKTLRSRLAAGIPPETAIATPPFQLHRRGRWPASTSRMAGRPSKRRS